MSESEFVKFVNAQAPSLSLILITVYSPEPERLLAFYAALGCEWKKEQHGKGPVHHACQLGEVVLEIYPGTESDNVRLGFRTSEVAGFLEQVEGLGGKVVSSLRETKWGYRCVVADPDGRKVELFEGGESI